MTALELFNSLGPLVSPWLEAEYGRRDLCIMATRIAVEVAAYFGIGAKGQPVRVILYNAAFASHIENDDPLNVDCHYWKDIDGSYSVGIGMGGPKRTSHWDGHLIAVADGVFGDFGISQAERPERGIITGTSIVGPCARRHWRARNEHGTTVEYEAFDNNRWRMSPDWRDEKRRRAIVARIIKAVR